MASHSDHSEAERSWTAPSGQLRVLELGSWLAAPGAAALLVDLGADVVKIEPLSGDPGRHFIAALGGDAATTPSFSLLNRGKRSLALDLEIDADRAIFDRLLEAADIFVTNLRPASLERLGLVPEAVTARLPRLIFATMTGLGRRGPERDQATFDVGGFWARSGLMAQLTPSDCAPASPTGAYGDIVTSLGLYAGIMSALWRRNETGRGAIVDSSLLQSGAFVMAGDLAVQAAHGRVPAQKTRSSCRTPLVNAYRSRDNQWFFLTGIEARRHLLAVCKAIGRENIIADARFATSQLIRRHCRDLVALFDQAFASADLTIWRDRFAANGVLWQPVCTPSAVLADPQLAANAMTKPIENGEEIVQMVTSPFNLDGTVVRAMRAPELGEHNRDFRGDPDDPMGA